MAVDHETRSPGSPEVAVAQDDADEATQRRLHLARAQGDAYGEALEHVLEHAAAAAGRQRAGDYWVDFAIGDAEGAYDPSTDGIRWRGPSDGDLHLGVIVRDAGDGRFVPGLRVVVTMIGADGRELGTQELPLSWDPVIYHYGADWHPADGPPHRLRVRVEPPVFSRRDAVDGRRFVEPVEVEFTDVSVPRAHAGGGLR
jgi:hypothetical protein